MKPLRFLILFIPILACAPSLPTFTPSPGGTLPAHIDFREYTKNGFLFTPLPPSGEYESKGLMNVELYPQVLRVTISRYQTYKEKGFVTLEQITGDKRYRVLRVTNDAGVYEYVAVELLSVDKAIEAMYQEAIDYGADAITNIEIQRSPVVDNKISYSTIEVSGFAVKRK